MNSKKISTLFFFFLTLSIWAQKEGYWDNERAFKKEVVVAAGERMLIKTDELPTGTTELVCRITLLDENQQMANSLFSVLKAIPDPYGIGQGSAGAVLLLSKISGTDKCTYAVFSNEANAKAYITSGNVDKACLKQEQEVNKDGKRISIEKSGCFTSKSSVLWFGFESKNRFMNQKIVLEIVPWVNIKLSRGWTLDNRKKLLKECQDSNYAKTNFAGNNFCVCLLNKIQERYSFDDFQKLMALEKSKAYLDFSNECLGEIKNSDVLNLELRNKAADFEKKGEFNNVIEKLSILVSNNKANAMDYNNLGRAYIMTKQYKKAIKYLIDGEKMDDSELLIKMNLAHAYLFSDDYSEAKTIHKKFQSQNVNATTSWVEQVKADFEIFKNSGLENENFDKLLKFLKS